MLDEPVLQCMFSAASSEGNTDTCIICYAGPPGTFSSILAGWEYNNFGDTFDIYTVYVL